MNQPKLRPETLDALQRQTFDYFVYEVNPLNGLVADSTQEGAPASIAAVGLALSAYPVGVEPGLITRAEAVERTLATLRFFWNSSQDRPALAPDAALPIHRQRAAPGRILRWLAGEGRCRRSRSRYDVGGLMSPIKTSGDEAQT